MGGGAESWDRLAARATADPPVGDVRYSPEGPDESELRLLGDVAGKRVLDLGCGAGQAAVTLAGQGATAIGVDASAGQLARARRLAERAEVRVEWHHGDLADLAFLQADSIDLAFSAFAVAEVDDLDRLLRQVHRVLRPAGPFVFSYEHPLALCTDGPIVAHPYSGGARLEVDRDGEPVTLYPRTVSEVFSALGRAGFRTEVLLEPLPTPPDALVPSTIVWRARKVGM